jgi:hypothetical protein
MIFSPSSFDEREAVLRNYHYEFQSHALGLAALFTPPGSRTDEFIPFRAFRLQIAVTNNRHR